VLVPTVRDALRAARRGDGERASAKLNGLGVVIGDLRGLYAGGGLEDLLGLSVTRAHRA
jgi:hypothetical protein